jgi:ATP-binding cassette subfamily B protein
VLTVAGPSARAEVRPLTVSALLGTVGIVLELARPWPLALAVDYAIADKSFLGLSPTALLVAAGVSVVLLTAVAGLVDMAAIVAAEHSAERIGARLREATFDSAMQLSLRWHDRMRSGELISRLTTDVGRLLDAIVAIASTLLPDAIRLAVVLVILTVVNPALALVALAVVPLLALFAVRQRRYVRSVQQDARSESGRFTATAADLVRNVRAVQAFGRAPRSSAEFRCRSDALRAINQRAISTEARWSPVADVVLALGSGLVLVVGGHQVLDGRLSTGDLLVVLAYLGALYSPVRGLSRLSGVLAKSTASAQRLHEVLHSTERVPDRPGALLAPAVSREVRFDNVRFGYDATRPVLDRFDLTVDAGETVCLFGPSGAGKSTILHLLLRLYDVDAGAVVIDGVDVRDIAQHSLRRRIAFVPQDPWLFDTTIAENIAYGSPDATRHGVLAAAHDALVDEFALRLPDGYDTHIGEAGARLSGGQRRRIALARAAVSDAPLVLLDEPTASLDARSSAAVIDAIRRSTAGRTVLLVTHDRDLADLADRVVVLDHAGPAGLRVVEPMLTTERR